jgi:hypothetical protein
MIVRLILSFFLFQITFILNNFGKIFKEKFYNNETNIYF